MIVPVASHTGSDSRLLLNIPRRILDYHFSASFQTDSFFKKNTYFVFTNGCESVKKKKEKKAHSELCYYKVTYHKDLWWKPFD